MEIDVKPWEWMVKPTPQTEWISHHGMLIWLAFFSIELGAGMYFVSIFLNNPGGMLAGWLILPILGGGGLFLHIGHKRRAWRLMMNFKSSWISRGFILIGINTVLGAVHLALNRWGNADVASNMGIVMGVFLVLVILYGGFVISSIKSIPTWNSPLIPVLFMVLGLLGGAELALALNMESVLTESWIRVLMPMYVLLLVIYMVTVYQYTSTGKHVFKTIISSSLAPIFYVGVLGLGVLLPLGVVIAGVYSEVSTVILAIAIAGGIIGDLSIRYCIFRCGFYTPLLTQSKY
ncbi:MAG: polysulfide reductase NrfD [Chloroflexi bacterium]|jgi:formate-dependent nitrite reductase membrane component NrfD|nr:polysulfide reductase NrfD [Chloroflexota bacterium]MBT7079993.1 polysulfide reductase NrfD [Chloroflexota bacterium]MBT7290570.1 polysulfide reductase NrfD [Chloroflexota bacterium]